MGGGVRSGAGLSKPEMEKSRIFQVTSRRGFRNISSHHHRGSIPLNFPKPSGEGSYVVFCLFRAAPAAYGGSQARGPIRATAAGLHHSHSNVGS